MHISIYITKSLIII